MRERASFVPYTADEQMFICLHEPPSAPSGSVLMCSSILADFLSNYQREVHLARSLAVAGVSVVRFHHIGTGNSDGNSAAVTLESLQTEAIWVREWLRERLGETRFAVIGTRWGALSAAAAARSEPGVPLVLCEPVLDPQRYLREAMRSRAMSAIATRKAQHGAAPSLNDLIAKDGYADIVGNIVYPALYRSLTASDPPALFAGEARPALIVQFGGRGLRTEYVSFEKRLARQGWTVDTRVIDLAESWWFRAGPRITLHPELNRLATQWLVSQFANSGGLA